MPKLRPVNNGAEEVETGNKPVADVVVVVLEPNKPVGCACTVVAGVLPNPKLRPVVVAGVEEVPKDNVGAVLVEPKGVPPKLKPVAGLT